MKLISCHIEHFGKLADFTYYFEDDLNIFLAENGWGKSTLAAFLKVMFYGFEGENKRNEEGNERLRYRPWSGGVYGGSVTFSGRNGVYRMLRTFGAKKKEDTFRLLDDATGLVCGDFTENIGEELFGIDRESFCRTVFWSQKDHETVATTLIQAKIGDLSAEQDDLPSYDLAMKQLKREIERLSPDRASGQIRRKEEQALVLEAEAARLPHLRRDLDEITAREHKLSAELEAIRAQRQEFTVKATAEYPSGDSGGAQLAELRKRLSASRDRLKMLQRVSKSAAVSGHRKRQEYIQVHRDRKELEEAALLSAENRARGLRAAAAISCAAAAVFLILIVTRVLPLPLLALSVILLAAGIFAFYRSQNTDAWTQPPELTSVKLQEEELRASLKTLSSRMHRAQEQALEEQQIMRSLEKKVGRLEKETATRSTEPSPPLSAREISDKLSPSLAEYDLREEKCRRQLQETSRQAEELRRQIGDCTESAGRLSGIRDEIITLRRNYDTCVKTADYLEKARGSFTSRYMNPFLRSFRRHYGMLTGESAQDIETDADFNITIMDAGLPRDPALMSEGTRDLISLCRRMAMIDAMYPGEKPFLVFDDPFSNLDDERVKGGIRFLQNASLEYQILYLTCHNSRV